MSLLAKYCIDTSALIDLVRRVYPADVFPEVHQVLDSLVSEGSLVSVEEAFNELSAQDDEVLDWAKKHRGMFVKPDAAQAARVKQILAEEPRAVDVKKQGPDADPWVVACCIELGLEAVTSEQPVPPGSKKVKIPSLCDKYGVVCRAPLDFLRSVQRVSPS